MKNPEYSYGMRTIAGAYLVYLAYQICGGYFSGESDGIHFLIIGLVFGVAGIVCVINGIRYFVFGKMNKNDKGNDRFSLENEEKDEEEK
ncbi:MAG: hypothetical protein U0L12_03990 [Ruminococcus sp.]|nr:hypothetical protein [Ruminococcus sp.]